MSIEARKSPFADREAPPSGSVRLTEGRPRGMIALKADLSDPAISAGVQVATGVEIPAARRMNVAGESAAIWMAPDELLLLTPLGEVGARVRLIEEVTKPGQRMVVDMSDARAVLQIGGARAREVLAKVAPFDLHPSAFGLGDFRRTRIGSVAAAIGQISDSPEIFEIYCFRSYADYLWDLLSIASADAARIGLFDASA